MDFDAVECVVNISEGRDHHLIDRIADAAGPSLLDLHSDPDHNRSVVTLGSSDPAEIDDAVRRLTRCAVSLLDLRSHQGVHPRIGVVDVVPFVPLGGFAMSEAVEMRNRFSRWAADELDLPCFLYGPERDLPTIRRTAFVSLRPDTGPPNPHPTAGAVAVGARAVLVAYNVWLDTDDVPLARRIATAVRSPSVRSLGLPTAGRVQVSCNLLVPLLTGPAEVYEQVESLASEVAVPVLQAELVGLMPDAALRRIEPSTWERLGLSEDRTIEARLARRPAQ